MDNGYRFFDDDDDRTLPRPLEGQVITAETLRLGTAAVQEMTETGSFDIGVARGTSLIRFLRALPIPVMMIDQSYTVVFLNEACSRISDNYAALADESFMSLFPHPNAAIKAQGLIQQIFLDRKARTGEAIVQMGENRIWGRLHLRPIRFGTERSVLALIEDLTLEKKQIALKRRHEKALQKARDTLARRVEERTAELKSINEQLQQEITERKRAQVALQRAHDELEKRVKQRTSELSRTNEKLLQEVAERKRAEDELRASEKRFRSLFESATEFIQILDTEGVILQTNPVTVELLGYAEEELVGKAMTDFLTPDSQQAFSEEFPRLLERGISRMELELVCKKGEIIAVDSSSSAIGDRDGRTTSFVAFQRDVTEEKRAKQAAQAAQHEIERALTIANQSRSEAEAANRAKSDFLANMSHELRTPLNAIIGFSEILEDKAFGDLNTTQSEYVGLILSSGRHLLHLIDDILDLAKVESGKMELQLSQVNLRHLLENSLLMVKERALRHHLTLDLNLEERLHDVEIMVDEIKVKQIMFNLLSNASKFTPDGGSISVAAAREWETSSLSAFPTRVSV